MCPVSEHNTGQLFSFFSWTWRREIFSSTKRDWWGETAFSILQCHLTNSRGSNICMFHCKLAAAQLEGNYSMTWSYSRTRMLINNSVLWREKRLINIDIFSIHSFYVSDICLSCVSSGNPATNEWQRLWNVYVQICRIHNQRKANQIYTGNSTP